MRRTYKANVIIFPLPPELRLYSSYCDYLVLSLKQDRILRNQGPHRRIVYRFKHSKFLQKTKLVRSPMSTTRVLTAVAAFLALANSQYLYYCFLSLSIPCPYSFLQPCHSVQLLFNQQASRLQQALQQLAPV